MMIGGSNLFVTLKGQFQVTLNSGYSEHGPEVPGASVFMYGLQTHSLAEELGLASGELHFAAAFEHDLYAAAEPFADGFDKTQVDDL